MIRGYLYKTAQSVGMLSKQYFMRRYYVLNKKTKVLTIHDKPDAQSSRFEGKPNHTIDLSATLNKVDTNLITFLRPDFMKYFRDSVKDLVLPKDNPLPFALYIKDQVAILWAATDTDYDLWVEAFQAIQMLPVSAPTPSVHSTWKNHFVHDLLRCLSDTSNGKGQVARPRVHSVDARKAPIKPAKKVVSYQSSTMVIIGSKIDGQLMKTAQRLSFTIAGRQKEYFYLRHYSLDTTSKIMYIHRVGKDKPDLTVNLF